MMDDQDARLSRSKVRILTNVITDLFSNKRRHIVHHDGTGYNLQLKALEAIDSMLVAHNTSKLYTYDYITDFYIEIELDDYPCDLSIYCYEDHWYPQYISHSSPLRRPINDNFYDYPVTSQKLNELFHKVKKVFEDDFKTD